MRLLSILALMCLTACVTSGQPGPASPASPAPAAETSSPEFLRCPNRPGQQYRPGFENVTCYHDR
jgi:hypothetical protein